MPYSSDLSYVVWNTEIVEAVGSVSFSIVRAPLDVTEIGKKNSYSIPGISTGSVSLDMYFTNTQHGDLIANIWTAGAAGALVVYWNGTTGALDYISGNAICTSFDIVSGTGDIVRASATFVLTGQIDYNTSLTATGLLEVVEAPAPGGG